MKKYYEHRAPWHDEYMSYTSNEKMETILKPIISFIEKDLHGKNILEIACGTGNWTQILSKRVNSVIAVDSSETSLKIAQGKKYFNGKVTFIQDDAYSLENTNGNFNLAFASDWFSHIPKQRVVKFLDNLHLKLQSASRVILLDVFPLEEFVPEFDHYDEVGNGIYRRILPDGSSFRIIKNFPDEPEMAKYLEDRCKDFRYIKFEKLKRWLVTYTTPG